jgi:glycogen operon protein
MPPFEIREGHRFPPGATLDPSGVNFSVFSRYATAVSLLLYAGLRDRSPVQTINLDPEIHRTFFFWHVFVVGARPGLYYTWKVDGPRDTEQSGFRFDPTRELLDPWARSVSDAGWDRRRATQGGASAIRAEVVARNDYDWQGDAPLIRPHQDMVIYEIHVRGFTRHESSRVAHPGTFRGVIEKIPHLKSLGVTDVELLPVLAFDAEDVPPAAHERGLVNYWGYSPYAFYAPHPHFSSDVDARREFRDMVKALHRENIGVILDVVLNHTAEGDEHGPTISFKGFGNDSFYHLDPLDKRRYRDFTGCGNTVNCNHPLVTSFLLQCLEFWARDMHVDGFRLDLASALARGEDGEPMYHAPLLWSIEFSTALGESTLIAEAWDAAGLYQVGDFPGFRWAEWNGRYRDSVRRFLRGDRGLLGEFATRIAGSSDLYAPSGRAPVNSVNFVTCHDGFTLFDLVSYDRKHNEANAENNLDGSDENFSWNSGVEGGTDNPAVNALREQRARNFLAVLMLSQGVPMLLAGDEMLRTQRGNNNAYCQDNEVSWIDWSLLEKNAGMVRFTREVIALRQRHRSLRRRHFLSERPDMSGRPDIRWYGEGADPPDWGDPDARVLCFTLAGREEREADLHAMINMSPAPKRLPLPEPLRGEWHRVLDTSLAPPRDISAPPEPLAFGAPGYMLAARAVAVFEAL